MRISSLAVFMSFTPLSPVLFLLRPVVSRGFVSGVFTGENQRDKETGKSGSLKTTVTSCTWCNGISADSTNLWAWLQEKMVTFFD